MTEKDKLKALCARATCLILNCDECEKLYEVEGCIIDTLGRDNLAAYANDLADKIMNGTIENMDELIDSIISE